MSSGDPSFLLGPAAEDTFRSGTNLVSSRLTVPFGVNRFAWKSQIAGDGSQQFKAAAGKVRRAVRERTEVSGGLSFNELFALGFGAIVGSGWIVGVGQWLGTAGPAGSLVAFACGAAVTSLVGLCYADMAARYPIAGGDAIYAYEVFGERAAFTVGWLLTLVYLGTMAFLAITFGWLLTALIPAIEGPSLYRVFGEEVHLGVVIAGCAALGAFAVANHRGVRSSGALQSRIVLIKVIVTLVFIVIGLVCGRVENLYPLFGSGHAAESPIEAVLIVYIATPYWYAGFGVITQGMSERATALSSRAAARAILLSIAAAFLFYALIIVTIAVVAPREVLLSAPLPAVHAFEAALGSRVVSKTVLLAGLLGVLGTCNALFFAIARILLSLARARMIPAVFARTHKTFRTPWFGIAFAGTFAFAASLLGRAAVGPIINMSGLVLAILFLLVAIGVLRLRLRSARERPHRHRHSGLVLPLAGASGASGFVAIALRDLLRGTRSELKTEVIVIVAWLAVGLALWFWTRPGRLRLSETARRAALFEPYAPARALVHATTEIE
jgi:APA family basic amino acid/polyamine antiporter